MPERRFHINMRVAEPIDSAQFAQDHANLNLAARALTEYLQEYLWQESQALARDGLQA